MKARLLALALLGFLGLVDTFYITIMRSQGKVECHITHGCNEVLLSKYSTFAGVPLALYGMAFYLAVFSCAAFELSAAAKPAHLIFWPALAGFFVSVALTGIQAFVLRAFCEYCLFSALLVTSILTVSFFHRRAQRASTDGA